MATISNTDDAKSELKKAQKQQGAWMLSAATVRLTKLCLPQCMSFNSMAVTKQEKKCLSRCVKSMYQTHV